MLITTITNEDLEKEELRFYSENSEVQLRRCNEPAPGCFIAESIRVIGRALDAGYEAISLLIEERHLNDPLISRLAGVPVYVGSPQTLSNIAGYKLTGGALCLMRRKKLPDVLQVLETARHVVVLEGINNPTNVGAIIRSAAALGMNGALLTHASVDPLTRRAARVSMGTCFQIPWSRATLEQSEGVNLIRLLQSYGFKTVAMALTEDSTSIDNDEIRANEKLAVIMGSEGPGLPKEVIAACDYRVMIPMYHGVDSLNVAAASAVAFWELMK